MQPHQMLDPITTQTDTAELASRLRLVVMRLSRTLRSLGKSLGDPGLSPSMLSALASVERCGPLSLSDLANMEGVRPPSMTSIVAALEGAGFVSRETDAQDRRIVHVTSTPRGRKVLQQSRRLKTAYLARRLRDLEPAEIDDLERAVGILERIVESGR
jgi:DNA-binding MarR family transcriptional regulator